jgi:Arc/MetJ family transcription regulator
MRTNIVINDEIMNQALTIGGYRTKKEAVEAGLKLIVRLKKQEEIKKYRGKLKWEGDLDEMRSNT